MPRRKISLENILNEKNIARRENYAKIHWFSANQRLYVLLSFKNRLDHPSVSNANVIVEDRYKDPKRPQLLQDEIKDYTERNRIRGDQWQEAADEHKHMQEILKEFSTYA